MTLVKINDTISKTAIKQKIVVYFAKFSIVLFVKRLKTKKILINVEKIYMNVSLQKKLYGVYIFTEYAKKKRNLKKALKNPTYWIKLQNKEIEKFVKEIYNVPFYQKRFDEAGIKPEDIKTREDFLKLPPLTKDELRQWIETETKNNDKYSKWLHRRTTGSTGKSLNLYALPKEGATEVANLFRCAVIQNKGYSPIFGKTFRTMISNSKPKKRLGFPRIEQVDSVLEIEKFAKKYNEFKPDFYYGNKTAILAIIDYARKNNIKLHKPKCVGSISEPLDNNARLVIEEAFGKNTLFDMYGCVETGNFAVDVISNPGKHIIWNDTHVVNLYNPIEISPNVYRGELMLTSMIHREFPVVNYLVGDTIEMTLENGVPYITQIIGRSNDKIKNQDGSYFQWMCISRIMLGLTDLIQYRVIQKTYDDLVFVLAARNLSNERKLEIENHIKNEAKTIFTTNNCPNGKNINIEWCEFIPADSNGKLRMLISEVE